MIFRKTSRAGVEFYPPTSLVNKAPNGRLIRQFWGGGIFPKNRTQLWSRGPSFLFSRPETDVSCFFSPPALTYHWNPHHKNPMARTESNARRLFFSQSFNYDADPGGSRQTFKRASNKPEHSNE